MNHGGPLLGRLQTSLLNLEARELAIGHSGHEQASVEEQVATFAARLGDEQAPVPGRPIRGPVSVLSARLVIGADRIVRADHDRVERAFRDGGELRCRGDEPAERPLSAWARRVDQDAASVAPARAAERIDPLLQRARRVPAALAELLDGGKPIRVPRNRRPMDREVHVLDVTVRRGRRGFEPREPVEARDLAQAMDARGGAWADGRLQQGWRGSIPARAGEPIERAAIDPRACGGAGFTDGFSRAGGGSIPRVRGSLVAALALAGCVRSIPARAGEPGPWIGLPCRPGVDPRACMRPEGPAARRMAVLGLPSPFLGPGRAGALGKKLRGTAEASAGQEVGAALV